MFSMFIAGGRLIVLIDISFAEFPRISHSNFLTFSRRFPTVTVKARVVGVDGFRYRQLVLEDTEEFAGFKW